jgi:hypothetical protein
VCVSECECECVYNIYMCIYVYICIYPPLLQTASWRGVLGGGHRSRCMMPEDALSNVTASVMLYYCLTLLLSCLGGFFWGGGIDQYE